MPRKKPHPTNDPDQLQLFKLPEDDLEDLFTMTERLRSIKEFAREKRKLSLNQHITALICYDIENDKIRRHIAKLLEKKGFYRIQMSVFLGRTNKKKFNALWEELKDIQDSYDNHDSIVAIPLTEGSVSKMKMIGDSMDFDLILDRKRVMII